MPPAKTQLSSVIIPLAGLLCLLLSSQTPAQNPGFQKKPMDHGGQKGGQGQGQQNNIVQQEIAFLQALAQQVQNGAITAEQLQTALQQRITTLQSVQQQQARSGPAAGQQNGPMKGRGKK